MRTNFKTLPPLIVATVLFAVPVSGQITILKSNQLARVLPQLNEVDFEELPDEDMPNPLRLDGVIFSDPGVRLRTGACSSPTCVPDPDSVEASNIVLFLNRGGSISFAQPRRVVVLDLQGSGTNKFALRFIDARGRSRRVVTRTVAFGVRLVPVHSPVGIRRVEIVRAGESRDALVLARVLFSDPILPARPIPNGGLNRGLQ